MLVAKTSTLSAPLAGGCDGAVVSIRALVTGEIGAPQGFLRRDDARLGRARSLRDGAAKRIEEWLPCTAFLLEHPTAGRLLVDTGLPSAVAVDPKVALGRLGAQIYPVRAAVDESLRMRLRALEIAPESINAVVMTHLHFDHTGGLANLAGTTVVVAESEWLAAHRPGRLARGYFKRHLHPGHDYRLVDYGLPNVNSFATFGRSFDLFGDGSVTLVSTPGHSAGHQSVVVRLERREALLCGDAIYTRRALERGDIPLILADPHNYRRSVREIRAYAQTTPTALVIPSHDAESVVRLGSPC